MKKTLVVILALILAGPSALRADPQDDLKWKVVRISGTVNGLGVVLLFKAGSVIILDEVDGSRRQAFDLKNRDYRLVILADSREAYLQMQADGLTPEETPFAVKPAPAVSAFAYLSEISKTARKRRISAAIPTLLAGGTVSIVSLASLVGNGFSDGGAGPITPYYFFLAGGLLASGGGALRLSLKTSAERSCDQAQKLPVEERNSFCADALKKESRKAQTGRYISAGLFIGLAAFAAMERALSNFYKDSYSTAYFGAIATGLSIAALLKIVAPSYEEDMYRRYLKEKTAVEQGNKLTMNVGLVPRGFALGLQYNF